MKLLTEITGVNKTIWKLNLLDSNVRLASMKAMKRGTLLVAKRAKELLTEKNHVKTGNLRRNIKTKVGWANLYELIGVIGTDVPYAPYVEALPDGGFLYQAARESGRKAYDYVREEISKISKRSF